MNNLFVIHDIEYSPGDTLVNQPKMYSAQKIDLDGIPMEEVVVSVFGSGCISGQ